MKKVGLIVNPIAGLGGYLAEGGSDRPEVIAKAIDMGIPLRSVKRASKALISLKNSLSNEKIMILSPRGLMGEKSVEIASLKRLWREINYKPRRITTREDTLLSAEELANKGVDLLLFSGGDGTARDILSAVGSSVVVLGIPSGVKVFSGVFAETPEAAGEIAALYIKGLIEVSEGEVVDVDELSYKKGIVLPRLYGYMKVPLAPSVQSSKDIRQHPEVALEGIYRYLLEILGDWDLLILGPGSTIKFIAERMGLKKSITGVDAYSKNGRWLDVDINQMKRIVSSHSKVKVVITPIGGTGVLLGRGNVQLTPALRRIEKRDLIVVATPDKIERINHLIVDLDDEELNEKFRGYVRVISGYKEEVVMRVI